MLPAHQVEALILDQTPCLDPQQDVELLDLLSATGRVLAQSISSKLDFPHWDNSAMDGYAVRYTDVQSCSTDRPVTLEIIEEIPAGYCPQKTVQPGQAARILTGSMMPQGADTIVIQEDTQRQGNRVTVLTAPTPQAFVRHRGEFYRAGAPLLAAGTRLLAPDIAVLAAAQWVQVLVFRRPKVAILSTGSELISPDRPLQPGQIVDSNQYALASLVMSAGADPILLGIVPDDPAAIRQAIVQAISQADMVLSSGGVSVGDYDYVDRILADLGAEIHVRAVAVKPGKPLTVATFSNPQPPTLYFGLPGNPVSALVSVWRFVQPALRKLSGLSEGWKPTFVRGITRHDLRSDGKRESYLWGRVEPGENTYEFSLASGSPSSGNLINLAQTNALAVVPIGQTHIPVGAPVQLLLI
ncbi:molybdopterin molybdotransferase MoeA [Thermocoleostomius sinensis]|uniref:Molybdopterin molybdenumtransferase n=1 Tax=Thermocoleostomius sinensis A174 TaxID=2016057 RepID=A0A9E8ZHJ3_9CYAN|nr:gephyrin-like molybdotransferase Glp [Thermocoleostomius sinensis]WAL58631.1 molybdopterin molybdotransferase MoeA [Thermocoleostomius sinensis A174]